MRRHIFLVSSGRLAAYDWQGGRFAEPLIFMADEEGLTQFSTYLSRGSTDPVYILVDFVEEEFREDTIPHVFGADRAALIRTKLNRLFRDATYSHAIFQGRESEGRRDDRMLFTALIRPDLLAPWIGQITKFKVPLAGIYSLPLVSESLLKPLGIDASHALLVSVQSAGGLRQTFFLDKRLKLSRLAVMPHVEPRGFASYVLGEVEKVRRYLNSLRLLPHDSPLDVYVIGDAQLLDEIDRQSPDSLTTRHHRCELPDVARKIGIRGAFESSYGDRVFAHMLAKHPVPNQYAPTSQTRYFSMYRARRAMLAASAALLVVGFAWGGIKLVEGVNAVRDTATLAEQTAFYENRYRLARERLPETPADSREMQAAVDVAGTLADYRATPLPMMAAISAGMDGFPRVQIENIYWKTSGDPEEEVGGVGRKRARRAGGSPSAGSETGGAAGTLYQLALVKGRIDPFDGDYRGALDTVSRFAESLRKVSGVTEVQVVSLPLDIGSQSRLSGDASVEAARGDAPFELRIVLRSHAREAG